MNRFQTLLLGALLPVFFITQLVSGYFVYLESREQITERSRAALLTTRNNFRNHLSATRENLIKGAAKLATASDFKRAIEANSVEHIRAALKNLRENGAIDSAVLLDGSGRVVLDGGGGSDRELTPAGQALLRKARIEGEASGVLTSGRRLFASVIVPVHASNPIAWLKVGKEINVQTVNMLRGQSTLALDITFARADEGRFDPMAVSSLNYQHCNELLAQISAAMTPLNSGTVTPIVDIDAAEHITLVDNLQAPAGGPDVYMIVNASINAALQPYEPLFRFLAAVAALGFLVTALFAIAIARGITRPLRAMVAASNKFQAGDYSNTIPIDGPQELQDLARSLNKMVSEIDERERQIYTAANYDVVSGLPNRNRAAFEIERLVAQQDGSGELVIILVHIENLTEVSNTLGHAMGAQAVKSAVDRLNYLSAEYHTLAQVRDDEFILVFRNRLLSKIDISASQVALVFDRPVTVNGLNIDLQIYLGVVGHTDEDTDGETLIRRAQLAADIARQRGRLFAIYDEEYDEYMAERLSLISDLRNALESDLITLGYQPKVDLDSNTVHSVEALMRWQDPERGTVSPEIFVPLAERTGFIRNLTSWVIRNALADCRRWHDAGFDITVAINLSAKDLTDERLARSVIEQIRGAGLPFEAVCFEITESAVIESHEKAIGLIEQLRDAGVGIAIDDFGTGESSMSYLKALPASELKIDKTFVTAIQSNRADEIIVRSAVDLGHNLGMRVTAEGVEDIEAEALLRKMGCDYGQGWLYAPPLAYDELLALLGRLNRVSDYKDERRGVT